MAKTADKLLELEFNTFLTLKVIETDEDLTKILTEEFGIPFNQILAETSGIGLNDGEIEYLKKLFNQIILTKKDLIDRYVHFAKKTDKLVYNTIPVVETPVEPFVPKVALAPIKAKVTKEKALPRRYGKQSIEKDIITQGGKATPLQVAMLSVNNLKNIYVNLSARGIKDMFGGTKLLSDADCRDIVSVVTIAERKLENILLRKK